MRKLLVVVGGIFVLFMLSFNATASAKPADSTSAKKQEQRVGKRQAAKKASAKRAMKAAPRHLQKKETSGIRFKKTKAKDPLPWYYNFWVLFMGGSMLFLAGGIMGSIARKIRKSRDEKGEEEGRFKRFFRKLGFFKASCHQPAT